MNEKSYDINGDVTEGFQRGQRPKQWPNNAGLRAGARRTLLAEGEVCLRLLLLSERERSESVRDL
jgi:hypothetical protein